MIISVINLASGEIADEAVHNAVRAINRQIEHDFEPYWGYGARLRLEGPSSRGKPDIQTLADMRGDAVLYLWGGDPLVKDAVGYHERNNRGIPYGFVFPALSRAMEESWTTTLSHEALELIGDPETNLLVQGPHPDPAKKGRTVFHWYEMCDAVQAESYTIDGVEVSNFVLPLYFTSSNERGGRNDFLGRKGKGGRLRSFGTKFGGYIGFFDPKTGKHHTYDHPDDAVAERRRALKGKAMAGRRNLRLARKL